MKQPDKQFYTSPHTGMTYRIDENLGKNRKAPMFPEKLAKAAELIQKADMRILDKRFPGKGFGTGNK